MTLEQTQYLSDHPQFHSATPLSDGSLIVKVGSGNTLTKISSQLIEGNIYRNQAYQKSKQDNPNLKGESPTEAQQAVNNIEPAKIKHMAETIGEVEGKAIDLDKAVEELKANPKYLQELTNRYSQAVTKQRVTEQAMRDLQIEASRKGDMNYAHRENGTAKLPSEM